LKALLPPEDERLLYELVRLEDCDGEGRAPDVEPAEGRVLALPVEGRAPTLPVDGRAPTLPVDGRAPTLPVEGRDPTFPVEGLAPLEPPQPRASLVLGLAPLFCIRF
jgi:hypothetical protein